MWLTLGRPPCKWGTRRLPWQHWFPSKGRRNLHFMIGCIKNAKVYKLQNRHIYSRCGPGHMTQFGESRSKILVIRVHNVFMHAVVGEVPNDDACRKAGVNSGMLLWLCVVCWCCRSKVGPAIVNRRLDATDESACHVHWVLFSHLTGHQRCRLPC